MDGVKIDKKKVFIGFTSINFLRKRHKISHIVCRTKKYWNPEKSFKVKVTVEVI